MSFASNMDYLMAHPGVVAVLVNAPLGNAFHGVESWQRVLGDALKMLDDSGEPHINATIGEHTILATKSDGQSIAVVYPTGEPVSKVIKRMVRYAAGEKPRAFRVVPVRDLPPHYKLESVTGGYRWARACGSLGVAFSTPALAVRQAWKHHAVNGTIEP